MVYGFKMCKISKSTFEISHQIVNLWYEIALKTVFASKYAFRMRKPLIDIAAFRLVLIGSLPRLFQIMCVWVSDLVGINVFRIN